MRDLTSTETRAVSGGRMAPAPRITFSVKLSETDRRALATVLKLLGGRKVAA